jgi:hypothetical protein
MMKKNDTFFWILPILVVLLAACTTSKADTGETSKDVQYSPDDLDRANKQYAAEVAVCRVSAESALRENKLKIAKLQDQKTALKEEALIVRNEKIAAIRKSNDELELRMRQYRGANRENWGMFKREFDSDMIQLGKSLRDLEKDSVE